MSYQPKTYREQGGDTFVVTSGGAIRVETGGAVTAPSGASLLDYALPFDIADGSADTVYYIPVPLAGTLTGIMTATDGAVGTANITITASIGGVAVTGGVVTIATAGSAAGDYDSASPSANNAVTAGSVIALTVAGGGSGGSPRIHGSLIITR